MPAVRAGRTKALVAGKIAAIIRQMPNGYLIVVAYMNQLKYGGSLIFAVFCVFFDGDNG
jgi:hypothetical protein